MEENQTDIPDNHSYHDSCNGNQNDSASHAVTYFVEAYVAPSIFILGIVTNALTLHVLRHMSLSKVCKTLLSTLCITDLLATIAGLASSLMEIVFFHGDMPFGHYCPRAIETYTVYFLFMMLLSMSHSVVIGISAIRVYSIWKPFQVQQKLTKRKTVRCIVFLYILVFVAFIPTAFYIMWQSCFLDVNTVPICKTIFERFPKIEVSKSYITALSFVFGPVIVIINLVCLLLLRRGMMKQQKDAENLQYTCDGETHVGGGSSMRKSLRISRVLFCVLIINTICIIPICIQSAMLLFDPDELVFNKDNTFFALFDVLAETVLQVIPCYNFWTYLLINKDFRRKFKKLYLCQETEDTSSDSATRQTSLQLLNSVKNGSKKTSQRCAGNNGMVTAT